MATVQNFTASLRTKKTTSASVAKSSVACQEFYSSGTNYVGIICFDGLNLTGKVITGLQLTITAAGAGYGAGTTKTVYLCQSNYQTLYADSATGAQYAGTSLGTFDGSFYNNTTTTNITGALFTAIASYLANGNNTFCIYNPSPAKSSQGYSYNYLQLTSVILTVAYDEAVSVPTVSSTSVNLGSSVTIYTNRSSTSTTHTITYSFGNTSGTIGTNVGASITWTPSLELAAQIPSAISGICTITCQSYNGWSLTGSRQITITLNVPSSVVPTITGITVSESVSRVEEKIGAYVKLISKPTVQVSASGAYGSSVSSVRTVMDGITYSTPSFTASRALQTAGEVTISSTVTDSRGRTATSSTTITVLDYAYPSIKQFKCERCNDDGSEAKVDGTHVRYTFSGSIAPINNKNAVACGIYYKLSSSSSWIRDHMLTITSYNLSATNALLTVEFDLLSSYDIRVVLTDYFYEVQQAVSIGTKTVILDFLSDGTGIGIGKMAETSGACEIGWPVTLSTPLAIDSGGTGADTAAGACNALGAVKKAGDTMTGDLNIQGYIYPSLKLKPTYASTKLANAVVEGNFNGIASLQACEDDTGTNKRQIEVRTKSFQAGLDYAALLRTNENGTWGTYRLFHSGMSMPVPIAQGGTGATSADAARTNLGVTDASILTSGTLSADRLPFKIAYGSITISGVSWTNVPLSGFTSTPAIVVSYGGNSSSSSIAPLKTANESASGFDVCMCGSSNSATRIVHWIAIGT